MPGRKNYSPQFKAKIALEAIKGEKTISQIASEFGIHPQQVSSWKKEFLQNMHKIFQKDKTVKELQKELDKAYRKIGQLEVENDFLSELLRRV